MGWFDGVLHYQVGPRLCHYLVGRLWLHFTQHHHQTRNEGRMLYPLLSSLAWLDNKLNKWITNAKLDTSLGQTRALGCQKIESKDLWLTSRERRKKGNNNNKSINIISLIDKNCRMKNDRLCLVGCWRPVCGWLSERGGCSCKRPHKPPTLPPQPLARIRQ